MEKIMKMIFLCLLIGLMCGCAQNNMGKNFSGQQDSAQIPNIPLPSAKSTSSPSPSPSPSPSQLPAPSNDTLLATAKTPIKDMRKSRLTNIALAIKPINAKTISPGETFSFNDVVGPRTKEKGYKKAIVFEKGEKKMDYGGGVCQISTTIYLAALDAGLKIVERHEHEQEVDYAPKGSDATVSYGGYDFKIQNTYKFPIYFVVTKGKKEIFVEIRQKS